MAAAAGIATLDLYEQEGLFERARALAPEWEAAVHTLRDAPYVIDVRNLGIVAGIELEPRAGLPGARAYDAFVNCFHEQDALIRVTGDIIALSPPLTISVEQMHELVGKVRRALLSIT
jgi:beta-alanine--pyruvate transaminase